MKTKILIAALGLTVVAGAGAAFADRRCEARVSDWQPRSAVVKMAEEKGWEVQRIGVDDGCYQLRVIDAQGRGMKVLIDPATLAVVKTKMGGEGRGEGRRWRGGEGEGGGRWLRNAEEDRRGARKERRRHHDDDDDDDDDSKGAPRQGRAPQLLTPDGAAASEPLDAAAPSPAPTMQAPGMQAPAMQPPAAREPSTQGLTRQVPAPSAAMTTAPMTTAPVTEPPAPAAAPQTSASPPAPAPDAPLIGKPKAVIR